MPFIDDENSRHGNQPYEGYVINAGGTFLYLTNQPVGGVLDGVNTFVPVAGLTRRRLVRKTVGVTGGEVEIRMSRTALASYVPGFPPNPFLITITRYQNSGDQLMFSGEVVNTRIEGADLLLRCVGKMELKMGRRAPGHALMPQCGRTLYDSWCRVARASHTFPVDITSVDDLQVGISTNSGRPDGYFANGEMIWGAEKRTITRHVGTTVWIDFPFNTPLEIGEEVTTHPGCDKSLPTCTTKYANRNNFQGAPFMPVDNVHVIGIKNATVTIM